MDARGKLGEHEKSVFNYNENVGKESQKYSLKL